MASLHLTIVTPERQIFDDEVEEVYLPTPDGEIGVLPHHVNLMAKVVPGELRIKKGKDIIVMATGAGLMQVANNTLSIMTNMAQNAEEIDENVAEEARKRAQTALEQTLSDEEYAETAAALEKSLAQLKVKRRYHSKPI